MKCVLFFAKVFALQSVLTLSFPLANLTTYFEDAIELFIVIFFFFKRKKVGYLPNYFLPIFK
jgi:hypothetical protein